MNRIIQGPGNRLRIALSLGIAIVLGACGNSTDPGGGAEDIAVYYAPTVAYLTHYMGEDRTFSVMVTGTDRVQAHWTVDGAAVADDTLFHYRADSLGVDTVRVAVQAADSTTGRTWYVTVKPETSLLPSPVNSLSLADGSEPGQVKATWVASTPTGYPLADYLVACSFDGPLTADNWDAATPLGVYPHQAGGAGIYVKTYGEADGMIPGATVWIAVRARDIAGQLSPMGVVPSRSITYAWTLHVQVNDDTGAPAQGIILNHDGGKDFTDGAGRADIGPLRNIDTVSLTTTSSLFDYTCPVQSVTDDTLRIVLINKYVLDSVPCSVAGYDDFLGYLRGATQTANPNTGTVLHKWDHYPLSVYIYAGLSPTEGWDMQQLCREALPIWNDALGETYLVETADSTAADIIITPTNMPTSLNGYTLVIDPGGPIGDYVPRKMRITIEQDLDSLGQTVILPDRYTEVALHELGHALGHYGHTCTNAVGNLMDAGGAIGSLADGADQAVNLDERRAVSAVRHLPEGVDMADYEKVTKAAVNR